MTMIKHVELTWKLPWSILYLTILSASTLHYTGYYCTGYYCIATLEQSVWDYN
jgi:hypothetical protein